MKSFSCGCTVLVFIFYCVLLITEHAAQVTQNYGHIAGEWKVNFQMTKSPIVFIKNNVESIKLTIYDVNLTQSKIDFHFELQNKDQNIFFLSSRVHKTDFIPNLNETDALAHWQGNLPVLAQSTGSIRLHIVLKTEFGDLEQNKSGGINVIVAKPRTLHEIIFQISAGAIILFMFINLGTLLDLQRLKGIVMLPIGPAVAFTSRYIIMPVSGLALGLLFFPQDKNSQLAVFFSMLTPSGGLANICNFFMQGNIDLSIAATTLNSLMTLTMFPVWIILLESVVYERTGLDVPFVNLIISFCGILIALTMGILVRLCFPKGTIRIVRFLKPLSLVLSLLLVAVTVAVHIVTFKYFTLMMGISALVLPLISYFVTYGLSKLLCMESRDAMTISLEIGVMNMTVPTLLLNSSLESSEANKVLALPITCAIISLLYVILFYIKRHFWHWEEIVGRTNSKSEIFVTEQ